MKSNLGFAVTEIIIVILWAVGAYFVVQDAKHCPEVGETIHIEENGQWTCR